MSCGNPVAEGSSAPEALMPRRSKFDKTRTCVKCKAVTGNIVVRHAVYCKTCFVPLIKSKVKRVVDPSVNPAPPGHRRTALKASGNLVLAYSGGLGSTALLDLVAQCYFPSRSEGAGEGKVKGGKLHPRKEKIWERVYVVYVETCAAHPGTRDRTDDARAVVEKYKQFEFVSLRLEQAFDAEWWRSVSGEEVSNEELCVDLSDEDLHLSRCIRSPLQSTSSPMSTPVSSLQTYLSSLPTPTAVSSATQTLVRLLLLHTAAHLNASQLLLGTSLTSLSIQLISGIAQGGGYAVGEEAEEVWGQSRIHVLRPLKDVGTKECAAYAWWAGLRVLGKTSPDSGMKMEIGALTRNFIVNLETDYPSTVSTIARTCGKLVARSSSDGDPDVRRCALCQRPVQRGVDAWKRRTAMRSLSASELQSGAWSSADSLGPHLCYACLATLTSRSSRSLPAQSGDVKAVPLPVWVEAVISAHRDGEVGLSEVASEGAGEKEGEVWGERRMSTNEMRTAVAEYLIE